MKKIIIFLLSLTLCNFIYSDIKVLKKINLEIEVTKKAKPKFLHEDSPVYIQEGFNNELIAVQENHIEVFNSKGEKLNSFGQYGEGPGDFRGILTIRRGKSNYYILDFPNIVNVFDKNFNFKKRYYLLSEKTSSFVSNFDIYENKIVCSQYWRGKLNKKDDDKCISVYTKKGKYLTSFFPLSFGWTKYKNESLLSGNIKTDGKHIYYTMCGIPIIYKLNFDKDIIAKKRFGKKWWEKIVFDEDKYKKEIKRKNIVKVLRELLTSGNRIEDLWNFKDNLALRIIKYDDIDYINYCLLISEDLKKESSLLCPDGYQFSGAGKYLYFTREINLQKNTKKVEVLKCDFEF